MLACYSILFCLGVLSDGSSEFKHISLIKDPSIASIECHTSRPFIISSSPLLTIFSNRLVATIGSKSNLKKVNRKAILDVDVKKACDTIIYPEAPMALRLQSNLL